MAALRVLQIVGSMNVGGIENFVMNLYRAADREKIQFDFLFFSDEKSFYDDEIISMGGRIFQTVPIFRSFSGHLSELKKHLDAHPEWETVHIHTSYALSVFQARVCHKAGRRVIIHSHSTFSDHPLRHKILRSLLPRYADKFFACSDLAAKWMFPKSAIKKGKVEQIKNGIDVARFCTEPAVRESMRKELGLENCFVLGHVGRFHEAKNHTFLLDVFAAVVRRHKESRLLLVGDGQLLDAMKKKARDIGVFDKVIFYGISSAPEKLFAAMDVFVFPSIYEGLPLTLIEAQAAGLPCFISSAVTREALLTPTAYHLPLSLGADGWAQRLAPLAEGVRRSDYADLVRAAGFDAEESARQIFSYYRNEK